MTEFPKATLRVGFVGSGFIAHFHLKSMLGVRNVEVTGVYSRSADNRQRFIDQVAELGLGACTSHDSLESMLRAGDVDAIWILSPNHTRLDIMRTIHAEVKAGRSKVFAVACEKPLARTVREARNAVAGKRCRPQSRLSGKSGVFDAGAARQGDHLAARRFRHRAALSGPRGGGACRPARALVLAG
jgi:hypothetical protein